MFIYIFLLNYFIQVDSILEHQGSLVQPSPLNSVVNIPPSTPMEIIPQDNQPLPIQEENLPPMENMGYDLVSCAFSSLLFL